MSFRAISLALLLLAAGCGQPPGGSVEETGTAPAAAAEAAAAAGGTPATPETLPMDAILGELTQAVRKYGAERRAVPKSLEELVTHGYLGQLPPAPPGKRFVITRDLRVVLKE